MQNLIEKKASSTRKLSANSSFKHKSLLLLLPNSVSCLYFRLRNSGVREWRKEKPSIHGCIQQVFLECFLLLIRPRSPTPRVSRTQSWNQNTSKCVWGRCCFWNVPQIRIFKNFSIFLSQVLLANIIMVSFLLLRAAEILLLTASTTELGKPEAGSSHQELWACRLTLPICPTKPECADLQGTVWGSSVFLGISWLETEYTVVVGGESDTEEIYLQLNWMR